MLFSQLVSDTPDLIVPDFIAEHSTSRFLAMTFVNGEPVDDLVGAPQEVRDNVIRALITVVVRELFEFGVMQTDPNFANYRYDRRTGRLALLDFGATRVIAPTTVAAYRSMLMAGLRGDGDGLLEAALDAGIIGRGVLDHHRSEINQIVGIVVDEIARPGEFDFGDRSFVSNLRDLGMVVAADQRAWHVPPSDMLFTQRKISGTALLAARLRARVNVRELLAEYL